MTDKKTGSQPDAKSRRTFLRNVAVGGGAVAVAAAVPGAAMAKTEDTKPEDKQEGYRLTSHVVDYYKSAL